MGFPDQCLPASWRHRARLPSPSGAQQWVDVTLAEHRALLDTIRHRFAALRPQRTLRRRQTDGDDIDLKAMGEPFAVQSFSGNGPARVSLWDIKSLDEPYRPAVALRIAALEPDQYTRTGAALRHASATLMREGAAHKLLLLLTDGKPNDCDLYEGRYGIEDTRQAVMEARLQGISPFCLAVDRPAASHLPAVFGAHPTTRCCQVRSSPDAASSRKPGERSQRRATTDK